MDKIILQDVYSNLKTLLLKYDLSDDEMEKIFERLVKAIVYNLIHRLEDELPKEVKDTINPESITTIEELFSVYKKYFSKETIEQKLGISTQIVLTKFLEKI